MIDDRRLVYGCYVCLFSLGLELHRPNLLLGLIIRQKLKRPHSASAGPSHTGETPESAPIVLPPDKKGKMESCTEEAAEEEMESNL